MAQKMIDLSLDIYHGAPTFAWDPKCAVIVHNTTETIGYNISNSVIVEGLAHLGDINAKEFFFAAAPMKIRGRDGSPVRAYAMIDDSAREASN